ncbi:MAG: hypothetical protein R2873_15505 [Caldilineaceae bacterium]
MPPELIRDINALPCRRKHAESGGKVEEEAVKETCRVFCNPAGFVSTELIFYKHADPSIARRSGR